MVQFNWVFLDLETTGLQPERDKIIEIAALSMDENGGKQIFHHLLNPEVPLPPHITRLTGITGEMIRTAPTMADIKKDLLEFLGQKVIVAHNAAFDLGFLEKALGFPLPNLYIDTVELAKLLLPHTPSYSLRNLVRTYQLNQEPAHRALPDTRALEKLFYALTDTLKKLPIYALQEICSFLQDNPQGLSWYLQEILKDQVRHYDFTQQLETACVEENEKSSTAKNKRAFQWSVKALEEMFLPGGYIAGQLLNYQTRTPQIQMLKAVAKVLEQERHLLVEAGTGVGKSLAYLVPALAWAVSQGEKIVVATHTIALQEQLARGEIKFLEKVLPFHFSAAVLKGRNNYLCLHKWREFKEAVHGLSWPEKLLMSRISLWLRENGTGDRDSINLRGWEKEFFQQVSSVKDTCLGSNCPFIGDCFYQRAKQKAMEADLIIVNHSLLLSDLKLGEALLPKYQYLVVDEAHHLEEEATKQFTETFSLYALQKRIGALLKKDNYRKFGLFSFIQSLLTKEMQDLGHIQNRLADAQHLAENINRQIHDILCVLEENPSLELSRVQEGVKHAAWWETLSILFANLRSNIVGLLKDLQSLYDYIAAELDYATWEIPLRQLKTHINESVVEAQVIENFFAAGGEEKVYWFERDYALKDLRLHITPIKVAQQLYDHLFISKTSTVLTSATLTVDGSFAFLIEQLGLPEELVDTLQIPSPFYYDEQSLLLVDSSLPDPGKTSEELYSLAIQEALLKILLVTGGRTLVLFTSYKQLRLMFDVLHDPLQQAGLELFADGINGSRSLLVEELKVNPQAVVFGANAFWEGIDLPGAALTSVIMVKLPFAPPNLPLVEARVEALTHEGKDGFYGYSLPQAVLRFRQGYGRLIRTVEDWGVIVVLDNRIVKKRYGKKFINSLPQQKYYAGDTGFVVEQVRKWFKTSGG
jgi:ATP-dependent DNA helicase DinG